MLRDVGVRDTSVELFGRRMPSPLMLDPIGVLELAHPDADLAVARAAKATGTTMVISNQASHPMERIAAELGDSPRWFQLYWSRSNDLVASLVSRAEACGCEAIAVTLDTTLLGWRTRDLDLAYLPFLRGKGIAQYTSDPVFNRLVAEPPPADQPPRPDPKPTLAAIGTLLQLRRSGASRAQVQKFTEIYSRPTLTWEDLSFLRERTKLPVLLKGIVHPDDARRAIEAGMDGIDRLQPRRPPGRRCDRHARRAARSHRRGRRPDPGPARFRGAQRRRHRSRRSRSAPGRCWSDVRTSTAWRSPARPVCAR